MDTRELCLCNVIFQAAYLNQKKCLGVKLADQRNSDLFQLMQRSDLRQNILESLKLPPCLSGCPYVFLRPWHWICQVLLSSFIRGETGRVCVSCGVRDRELKVFILVPSTCPILSCEITSCGLSASNQSHKWLIKGGGRLPGG